MADVALNETTEVTIVDGSSNSGNEMIVNSDGSINVSSALSTPPTSTAVVQTAFGSVSTTSGSDTNYTITNAKDLTIQRLSGASEDESGGTAIELFYDPSGTGTPLTRINMLIVNGATYQLDLQEVFTGNGTARIIMRRRGYTAAGREVFGRWEGYEV